MDYIRVVNYLVPDVVWQDGLDGSSLQSIRDHFTSPSNQPFPTNQEGLDAWDEIQAQEAADAVEAAAMDDLDKVETYLTNALTPMSIPVADRVILRDTLLRMFKYLKYGR